MAEINDLGDIQSSFEHITEVLDSMRAQNAMNAGDMDKVLANINLSLETLAKEEDSDFVNVFLSELKRSLEEKHNFVSSRFEEIESSFKNLVITAEQQVKADDLKPIFEAISTNLNGFAGEVASQKALLADLSLRLDDLRQDDSTKKDVLKNISVLKTEIEKFNNGFESIIVNLNDNFRGVTQALLKIDSTDLLDSVKKDIENIFLSSNAVLSALQVIDRKNRDLEEVLTHVVTKEDFVLERNQVASLISQNIQLTDYISKLPTQDLMDGLTQRVDTAVGVINALKNVLNETSDQNQKMLVAQLDNLEAKIINISSEDEFVGFRKELSSFAQEVIQSTNLMRADLMTTNSELKELLSYLTVLDIKDKFEHLAGLTQFTEENIKINLKELSEKVSNETGQSTRIVTDAVSGNFQNVSQKIDSVERNIVETSKSNFANVLDNVQSVLTNLFAMKDEIKVDSLEGTANLDSKLSELRDDLISSKDAIVINSQQNLESLLEGIETVSGQLDLAERNIKNGAEVNVERILSTVTKLSAEVLSAKQGLNQGAQENLENILSNFEQLSSDLAFSKNAVVTSSKEGFDNISSSFDKISQELLDAQRNLGQNSRESLSSVLSRVANVSEEIIRAKEALSQDTRENFENMLSIVGRFSSEVAVLKDVLSNSSQENFDNVFSRIDRISQEISNVQGQMNQVSSENLSSILSSVAGLSEELSSAKAGLNESSAAKFDSVLSSVAHFSGQMDRLQGNLDINSQSTIESVKAITEELSSNLNSFKSELLVTEKSNTVWIKSMIDSLSQELELAKDSLETKSNVNFESITSRVEELSAKIEEAHEFTNNSLSEQVSEVKSSISTLPSIIQENQAVFEDEKRALIEQNSRNIEELVEKIQSLTKGIINKDNPFKESIVFEIAAVRTLLTEMHEELSQKNMQVAEDIGLNIQGLERLMSKVGETSEGSLLNLQAKLTDYLSSIQDVTNSSDLKLQDSRKEIVEIKSDIQTVKAELSALNADPRLTELSFQVNKKLEGILLNITQFEELSGSKSQDNLQRTLTVMEEQFEKIMANLEEHKNVSSQSLSEILENLTEKIAEIQEQARVSSTTVAQIVNSRSNEIVGGFSPVKEAIEKVAQVDFDKIIFDLKSQLESSYDSFSSVIKSDLQDNKSEVLNKISQEAAERFASLNDKLEALQAEASMKNSDTVESFKSTLNNLSVGVEHIVNMVSMNSSAQDRADRKDFLTSKFENIESIILDNGEKNVRALESTIKMILEQIQGLNTNTVSIEEVVISARENLVEKLEKLENVLVQSQNDISSSSKAAVFEKLNRLESSLNQTIEASQSNSQGEFIDQLNRLEASLILNQSDAQYSITDNIESKIENKFEELKSLDESKYETLEALKTTLVDELNRANNENSSLLKNNSDELFSLKTELVDVINNIKSAMQEENSANVRASLEEFSSLKTVILEGLNNSTSQNATLLSDKLDGFSSAKFDILEEIKIANNENASLIRGNSEDLISLKTELVDVVSSASNTNSALFKNNSDELFSLKAELVEVINNIKSAMQEENSQNVRASLEEFSLLKTEILERIGNSNNQNAALLSEKLDGFSSAKFDILEEINSAKNESVSLIRGNAEELISLKTELVDVVNSASNENVSLLKGNIDELNSLKAELFNVVNNAKDESVSLMKDNADELISLRAGLVDEINSVKNIILGDNNFSAKDDSEDIYSAKLDILEEINNAKNESVSLMNGNAEELISLKYDVLGEIKNARTESSSLIERNLEELNFLKADIVDEINIAKAAIQDENSSRTSETLDELTSIKIELLEGINNAACSTQDVNADKIDSIKAEMDEIVREISNAQEGISAHKLDIAQLLKISEENTVSQFSAIENTILEGVSQNVEDFKATVEATAQQIGDKISLSEENYKTSTQSLLADIKSSFYSKVEENLDELKSFMEVIESRADFSVGLDNLKAEMFEKISILADDVDHIVSSISFKGDLDALRSNVETSVGDLLDGMYERIALAIADDKTTQDVFDKSEEIARRIEDLKRTVEEDISEKLDGFGLSIDKQSDEFSNSISEIKVSLNELKENYVDLSLNSSMEISSLLSNVQGKIESISNRLDGYDFSSIVDSAKSQLLQEISSVKDGLAKFDATEGLSEEFQGINQKLDLLAITSNDELENDIIEIKESITAQGKFINELKALEKLDKLSKLDEASVVQSEIKKIVTSFQGKLDTISSQKVETVDHAAEVKEELKGFKKDILECVLNVFDQVSFVVEAEEIKDFVGEQAQEIMEFVEAKTNEIKGAIGAGAGSGTLGGSDADEFKEFIENKATEIKADINENIKDSLGNNFNDILSSLDILHDKARDFDGGYSDIKSEIIDVKNHLQSLQSDSDDSDYSYTFQDIESDIAKVRLVLNELSKSKQGDVSEQIGTEKLSEDIMSISTRTNKLLLTSEESHNTLKVNLDEFRHIVYNLEDKVRRIDNTDVNKKIERKIDAVNSLVLSSVQSDKIFNQAFTYLAEWVDNASETMSSINEKVEKISEVDEVKQSIAEIKKTVLKKSDLTAMLDNISDKFEQQQNQIERLEEKIERLASRKSQSSSKLDIEAIVAEVLAQVGDNAGKADVKTAKKVDNIEKQLTKLSKNIEKLTSYVDAE